MLLLSRVAPPGSIRLWCCVFGQTEAPRLSWYLDGQRRQPTVLRQMTPVRPAAKSQAPTKEAFAGVFDFDGLAPGSTHTVRVTRAAAKGTDAASLIVRSLPRAVPRKAEGWFSVLLLSCFHYVEEARGRLAETVRQIQRRSPLDMVVLLGDQVYLDLPTLKNFKSDRQWLAAKFERDYARNWRGPGGLAHALRAAPSISVPDDHEYWNNAPHPATIIPTTWTKAGRRRWNDAATALWNGFQRPYPARLGEPVVLDIAPLSFFFADTRSVRASDRAGSLSPTALAAFERWAKGLRTRGRLGVLATGQSLVRPAAGAVGRLTDYQLADYADYATIMQHVASVPSDILLIAGDVHWGRVAVARSRTSRTRVYEVIASPTALVTDPRTTPRAWVRGARGAPFPRHRRAAAPPSVLASEVLGNEFDCQSLHGQTGDHVAVLSFRRSGTRVESRISYWPLHRSLKDPVDVLLPTLG